MAKIKIKIFEKSRKYFKKNPRIKRIFILCSYYYGFLGMVGSILLFIIAL